MASGYMLYMYVKHSYRRRTRIGTGIRCTSTG